MCSDYPEPDASRAIAISIAILRHLILKGVAAKAAISTGDLSGIKGCYPQPMCDASEDRLDLGMGLMTIIPVMGTALTKAHKLGASHKGAVLVVEPGLIEKGLPLGIKTCKPSSNLVNWISSSSPLADEIAHKSGLLVANPEVIYARLTSYFTNEPTPPANWIEATLNGLEKPVA